jgi:hypothetical protein
LLSVAGIGLPAVKKRIVWALALGLGTLSVGSTMYALPSGTHSAVRATNPRHGSDGNQLQAPPPPPRQKPVERVVVTSK